MIFKICSINIDKNFISITIIIICIAGIVTLLSMDTGSIQEDVESIDFKGSAGDYSKKYCNHNITTEILNYKNTKYNTLVLYTFCIRYIYNKLFYTYRNNFINNMYIYFSNDWYEDCLVKNKILVIRSITGICLYI